MKTPWLAAAVLLGLAWPARVSAIELSLEENKAERGNIGFVDTQRLFKLFPETIKAKENFEEAVRQAEDQVNLRKAEVLRLRKDLDALKVERAALAKSTPTATVPPVVPPPAPPAPAPVKPAPTAIAAPTPVISTAAAVPAISSGPVAAYEQLLKPAVSTQTSVAHLPGFPETRPAVSSAAASQPLVINLPGATTGPVVVAPPAGPPPPPVAAPPLPAPVTTAAVPPPSPPAAAPMVSTSAARAAQDAELAALDARIAQKTHELELKQAQAKDEQESAERNLLDLESRKSEILLGKIYKAVQEVARREGVSVVVDKTGILYGHNAVDLTEKVLKYLKGA